MKRKSDIRIGQRAYSEVCRLFPNEKWAAIARKIGCDKKAIFTWRDGCAPSPDVPGPSASAGRRY